MMCDLLLQADFGLGQAIANVRTVDPDISVFLLSARSREGLDAWSDWIGAQSAAVRLRVV
jgi:hydrogenase nickel incorporation protein HypB